MSTVKDSFRLNVDAVSLEDGMTGTFKAALTDAEILQGREAPGLTMENSSDGTTTEIKISLQETICAI